MNWSSDGAELAAFRPAAVIRNRARYFKMGVTWGKVTSGRLSARLSPGGFVFDVAGLTIFTEQDVPFALMGILNSKLTEWVLRHISPTVNFEVGHIASLPVPAVTPQDLRAQVQEAIEQVVACEVEAETSYSFISPPIWQRDPKALDMRHARLGRVEQLIDEEVYRLYGLTDEDRRLIEIELAGGEAALVSEHAEGEEASANGEGPRLIHTREELAVQWITYAVGIVLGRFAVGEPEGLGRGNFPPVGVASLKKLVERDGLLADDPGQPRDLIGRVLAALEAMHGAVDAAQVAKTAGGGGESLEALRSWLRTRFWKEHFKQYRKRPIYWPLQSPKKRYTVWLFHEKLGPDTLSLIRMEVVEPRLRLSEREIADLRRRATKDRRAAKELERQLDLEDDLRAFASNLKAITGRGYTPRIDDGVLLNAAPLHALLPSWPETRKAWRELETGEYDWAHQAMDYWPDRVREKCRTNRSYAIAHGLDNELAPLAESAGSRRRRK